MAREKFKIENKPDAWIARNWIRSKLAGFYFPYTDDVNDYSTKNYKAEESFNTMDSKPEEINTWCEAHLNKDQWKKLKGAIRAGRLRISRKSNYNKVIKRIDISPRARYMLQDLSKHHGVTYSEIIEKYLDKPFMDLPEKEE